MKNNKFTLERNENGKSLLITCYFAALVSRVWDAWTKSALLEMWWAPKPWKTETKTMDMRPGGLWLYTMCGPDGEKHWSRADIITVDPVNCLIIDQAFCDENGSINTSLPSYCYLIL